MDATLPIQNEYKVDLDVFEGPLDLLLHLIRKDELDIYDIPIGHITEQYMAGLSEMKALDIDIAGEFIVMAATLMSIKSRMLLPRELAEPQDIDDTDEPDPRSELVKQLIEYKKFKDSALIFNSRELFQSDTFSRGGKIIIPSETTGRKLGDIGLSELVEAFKQVLQRSPTAISFGHLKSMRWSVPEKMQNVLSQIQLARHRAFNDFFDKDAPKGEIIVTFIAMLELLRLRHITINQIDTFGEIFIDVIPEDVPDAHLPLPAFEELDIY